MKINFAAGNIAVNNIGILFSTKSFQDYQPYDNIWGTPTNNFANIFSTNIITDAQNWTKISGSIIADSGYQYILIGNFFDINHIDTSFLFHNGSIDRAYYFLDNICVSTDSLICNPPVIINETNKINNIKIYPNPANKKLFFKINNIYKQCEIVFFDLLGKRIAKQILYYPNNEIIINDIESGMYLIQILVNNEIINKKLIITKK